MKAHTSTVIDYRGNPVPMLGYSMPGNSLHIQDGERIVIEYKLEPEANRKHHISQLEGNLQADKGNLRAHLSKIEMWEKGGVTWNKHGQPLWGTDKAEYARLQKNVGKLRHLYATPRLQIKQKLSTTL